VKLSHGWSRATPLFDGEHLVSLAGLVSVMALAERAGLSELISGKVALQAKGEVGGSESGGRPRSSPGWLPGRTASTIWTWSAPGGCRGCSARCTRARRWAHLVNLVQHSGLLPSVETQAFIDIDSLLRLVYGHTKQGASFGIPATTGAPSAVLIVVASGDRPRRSTRLPAILVCPGWGPARPAPAKGAASMVREAIGTARAAGAGGPILVRGNSAYGNSAVVGACVNAGCGSPSRWCATTRWIGPSAASPTTRGRRCATRAQSWIPTPAS
jgi:hypothetical protein